MNKSSYEQVLEEQGRLVYSNTGYSMLPLLRQHRDLMVIEARPKGRCKKYDAVLYRRDNQYILHRILKVRPNDYVICGDHNWIREFGIKDEQIVGILKAVVRDGKEISVTDWKMRLYAHLWCDFYYVRAGVLITMDLLRRIKRKIIK